MTPTGERFWTHRLRWRLLGAWGWPAFAAFTLADALLLNLLPPIRTGVDLVPALIVAAFGNLALVGLVAPWLARRLEQRERGPAEPSPPYAVLLSRTATALLVLGALGLVAAGLAQRPVVVSETEDTEAAAEAIRELIERDGPAEARRNLDSANTDRLEEGYFRICVARDDRRRAFCWFVDTGEDPPEITPDPDQRPNPVSR